MSDIVTYEATQAAVTSACELLLSEATFMAGRTGRKMHACLATVMLPYVKNYVDPQGGEALARYDNRVREWKVKVYFWDVTQGNDGAVLLADSGEETVRGMAEVATLLLDYKEAVHTGIDVEQFGKVALSKRLGGMRPAISRGGGQAVTRITYKVAEKTFMCQVEIERA